MRLKAYTELVGIKRGINDGLLPPMMPIPQRVQKTIDPAFTIGLGAFHEDPELGLQCPVRGCGLYFHNLGIHLTKKHSDLGGARQIKRALSVPVGASLASERYRREREDWWTPERREAKRLQILERGVPPPKKLGRRALREMARSQRSTAMRNLRNMCDVQLLNRLADLRLRVRGHEPTGRDGRQLVGAGFVAAVCRAYGSWDAALSRLGAHTRQHGRGGWSQDVVLDTLVAYAEANGHLPSHDTAKRGIGVPFLPPARAIIKALGARGWRHAMELASACTGKQTGRLGRDVAGARAA